MAEVFVGATLRHKTVPFEAFNLVVGQRPVGQDLPRRKTHSRRKKAAAGLGGRSPSPAAEAIPAKVAAPQIAPAALADIGLLPRGGMVFLFTFEEEGGPFMGWLAADGRIGPREAEAGETAPKGKRNISLAAAG